MTILVFFFSLTKRDAFCRIVPKERLSSSKSLGISPGESEQLSNHILQNQKNMTKIYKVFKKIKFYERNSNRADFEKWKKRFSNIYPDTLIY